MHPFGEPVGDYLPPGVRLPISSFGGKHLALAVAKTDAPEAAALAVGAQDDRIAVLQKGPRLAIGQGQRIFSAC